MHINLFFSQYTGVLYTGIMYTLRKWSVFVHHVYRTSCIPDNIFPYRRFLYTGLTCIQDILYTGPPVYENAVLYTRSGIPDLIRDSCIRDSCIQWIQGRLYKAHPIRNPVYRTPLYQIIWRYLGYFIDKRKITGFLWHFVEKRRNHPKNPPTLGDFFKKRTHPKNPLKIPPI